MPDTPSPAVTGLDIVGRKYYAAAARELDADRRFIGIWPTLTSRGILGEAAAAAARTDTFLGERYWRLVKRSGQLKALVAVARSILVIIWYLLSAPAARFCELGSDVWETHGVRIWALGVSSDRQLAVS
jgi:hypothetical protein